MMWGYSTYNNPAMMVWIVVETLLCLAFVGLAIWALVRWLHWPSRAPGTSSTTGTISVIQANTLQSPSALDLLKQRYARGEIDAAMFAEMRATMEASDQSAGQNRESVTSGR